MSPYYKAVVTGKKPVPRHWCGVFVSLHEKVQGHWQERVYAYNLYRGGEFSKDEPEVQIGASTLTFDKTKNQWTLSITEPGLWRGRVDVKATFTAPKSVFPTSVRVLDDKHTWGCIAPVCAAKAQVTTAKGETISFTGSGYHDHNFGQLPWDDVGIWHWGRAPLQASDGYSYQLIYYYHSYKDQSDQMAAFLFDESGHAEVCVTDTTRTLSTPVTNAYGMNHETFLHFSARGRGGFSERFLQIEAQLSPEKGLFAEGSFYRRVTVSMSVFADREIGLRNPLPLEAWEATGEGIAEVFRPARLCGPIASRAMWTRMRRRS